MNLALEFVVHHIVQKVWGETYFLCHLGDVIFEASNHWVWDDQMPAQNKLVYNARMVGDVLVPRANLMIQIRI